MFEIYKKKVTIEDNEGNPSTYELAPLSGKDIGKLMNLVKAFSEMKEDDTVPSAESIEMLHELLLKTFVKSYPKEDANKLEDFVSQNMFVLIEPLVEVNLNNKGKR